MEEFIEKFAELFEDEDISNFKPETKFRELEGWSSIVSLYTIAMIDENYGVQIGGKDIRESETISDLYNKISNYKK